MNARILWAGRVDRVTKAIPPINEETHVLFDAEDEKAAVRGFHELVARRWRGKHGYRFISCFSVSRFYVTPIENGEMGSGQGVTIFSWEHRERESLSVKVKNFLRNT